MTSLDSTDIEPPELPDELLQVLALAWRPCALQGEAFAQGAHMSSKRSFGGAGIVALH